MMLGLSRDANSIDDMEDLFAISDLDGDGFVNQDEALAILSRMGIEISESDIKEMITKADKDGNGKLDLAEFKVLLTSPSFPTCTCHTPCFSICHTPICFLPKAMLFDSGIKLEKDKLFNYVNKLTTIVDN